MRSHNSQHVSAIPGTHPEHPDRPRWASVKELADPTLNNDQTTRQARRRILILLMPPHPINHARPPPSGLHPHSVCGGHAVYSSKHRQHVNYARIAGRPPAAEPARQPKLAAQSAAVSCWAALTRTVRMARGSWSTKGRIREDADGGRMREHVEVPPETSIPGPPTRDPVEQFGGTALVRA
jgi:hypothetical protein